MPLQRLLRSIVEHGVDVRYDPVVQHAGPLDGINLVASEIVSSEGQLTVTRHKTEEQVV